MEIRVSTGRYRTADDVRTTAKDRDLALKAPQVLREQILLQQGRLRVRMARKAGGTGSLAGAAAHEENRFAKYVSVSQQSIQKDYFSPRLMIDFSGLRIVGAGAGGFADPYQQGWPEQAVSRFIWDAGARWWFRKDSNCGRHRGVR